MNNSDRELVNIAAILKLELVDLLEILEDMDNLSALELMRLMRHISALLESKIRGNF